MAASHGAGKRDFGSFHSSNVEELILQPEETYRPPSIPVELPVFSGELQFGQRAKEAHFYLDDSWTFINHGAFGAALKQALTAATAWQVYCERQPLRFLDRDLLPLLVLTTRRLAKFIDAAPRDVVLVPNVTTGVNAVVQSVCRQYSAQDTVLIFGTAYSAVRKCVQQVASETGFSVQELSLSFPLHSSSQIMEVLEAGLRDCSSVRLLVTDHISSNYGLVFPVTDIVTLCHSRLVAMATDTADTRCPCPQGSPSPG
jgi:selenocysteine lyase/cysteine desulfurase